MKVSPCKGCEDRYLACHDYCDRYKKWKKYVEETKMKQSFDHGSYRSRKTEKEARKNKKKYSATYTKNKF